jgi:hypothetical protein
MGCRLGVGIRKSASEKEGRRRVDDRRNVARDPAVLDLFALLLLRLLLTLLRLLGRFGLAASGPLYRFGRMSSRAQAAQQYRAKDQLPLHVTYVTTAGMNGK